MKRCAVMQGARAWHGLRLTAFIAMLLAAFLRPAFEKFKPGAQRRFLARVAALTGMGGA